MIDGGLWDLMKRHWPESDVHWTRIETGYTVLGVPDVNGCWQGQDTWLELKGTSGWKPRVRPEQIGWAIRRGRAGGRVCLLTRRATAGGVRVAPADELYVHLWQDIERVAEVGLREGPPAALLCRGGPERWNWDLVHEVVFG